MGESGDALGDVADLGELVGGGVEAGPDEDLDDYGDDDYGDIPA